MSTTLSADEAYEETHVHAVYEQIATHFSATRYKPWPIIERFLQTLPPGSVGLDVGCGNGKYLGVNRNVYMIGSDRSPSLAQIARAHVPHSAVVADVLALPHAEGMFDFAICIAVVHHLSTRVRRQAAIGAVLATLRRGGQALVYVWAVEQTAGSRRGWAKGDEQDVMVPWVRRTRTGEEGPKEETFQRYYHLYCEGELEEDVRAAAGEVVEAGYEKDNWWVVARRKDEGEEVKVDGS